MLRARDGFYEDECWAIVAFMFPQLFTGFERRCAERTMKDVPDAWRRYRRCFSRAIRKKDERVFLAKHADDWIVVSAIHSDHESASPRSSRPRAASGPNTPVAAIYPGMSMASGCPFGFVIDRARRL